MKYFALELNEQAYKSLVNIPEANLVIKQAFLANLNNEMKNLVSSSVLRNSSPTDLTAFRLETFQQELAEKAPETFHLLEVMCSSERKKLRDRSEENAADDSQHKLIPPVIPTIASMILHSRCSALSAMAYRIGLLVRYSGAGRVVSDNYVIDSTYGYFPE